MVVSVTDSGVLVLDTSCFGRLVDPVARHGLVKSLKASDLTIWPSVINAVEIIATPQPRERARLAETISELADGRPLLPWPLDLLRDLAITIDSGGSRVQFSDSPFDDFVAAPEHALELREAAIQFVTRVEEDFDRMHADARREVQAYLKSHGMRHRWESAASFLDDVWMRSDMVEHFASLVWEEFGLGGKVPYAALLRCPTWHLFLEAEGLAVFDRGVAVEQPRSVQRLDFLQLVYLGGSRRRILASADGPFLRAAVVLLTGRHANSRAMHIDDLLAAT